MKSRSSRYFASVAGSLLVITEMAKLASATGSERVLEAQDPILLIPFRWLFVIVGVIELILGFVCLLGNRILLQARLLAWLSTSFAIYRLGLRTIGFRGPCHCLGNLTAAFHVSPRTADSMMILILAYILIGSYVTLFIALARGKSKQPGL